MAIASRGATMAVDWEQRVDFARLRRERLERAQAALRDSDFGALLLFDPNNIRYTTSTHIGEWARDKNPRFALVFRDGPPILWDFGSAARHHKLYAPCSRRTAGAQASRACAARCRSRRIAPRATGARPPRIEEEVLVTADCCEVLTKFPADELLVTGRTYVRGADIAERATGDGVAATDRVA